MPSRRVLIRALPVFLALLAARPPALAGQFMLGIGPVIPTGDLNAQLDARPGWAASARLGVSLLLLSWQFEWSYARFRIVDPEQVSLRPVSRFAVGANLAAQLIRVGRVRPYALIGGSVGSRRVGGTFKETSWRFGYHVGGGVDVAVGPVKPFVELRYVSVDGPGAVRDTYVPVFVGLRVF